MKSGKAIAIPRIEMFEEFYMFDKHLKKKKVNVSSDNRTHKEFREVDNVGQTVRADSPPCRSVRITPVGVVSTGSFSWFL